MKHKAEDGAECTQHPASAGALMTFAVIGSRVSSFNHDIASKLQGMMMALDEIEELLDHRLGAAGDSDLRRATETAQQALKEASALLSTNRSLTRTSTKTKTQLRDVVRMACERAGVEVRGEIPDGQIEAVVPLLVQGLGLAIDAIAATGRGRFVDVIAAREGDRAKLELVSTAESTKSLGDAFALASFVIERAGGELRCGHQRLHVQLPLVG